MHTLTVLIIFGFLSVVLYEVESQLLDVEELLQAQQQLNGGGGSGTGRMISNSIRGSFVTTALDRAVKFIVGNTATASPEMIQYGIAMRSEPRTQAERDVYVNMMKAVARRTPEVLMKYMKTEVQKNGTRSYSVDFLALDADITRRALLYQEMRESRRRSRQREREQELQLRTEVDRLNMLRDMRMDAATLGSTASYLFDGFGQTTPLIGINTLGNFGTTTPSTLSFGPARGNGGTGEHQLNLVKQPTVDTTTNTTGTISLLDLLIRP